MKMICSMLVAASVATFGGAALTGCTTDGHNHSGHSHGTAATKPYPLNKCLVTDEAFEHGKPHTFVHEGQEIKLCCKDCLADFNKEPAKYLAKLSATK